MTTVDTLQEERQQWLDYGETFAKINTLRNWDMIRANRHRQLIRLSTEYVVSSATIITSTAYGLQEIPVRDYLAAARSRLTAFMAIPEYNTAQFSFVGDVPSVLIQELGSPCTVYLIVFTRVASIWTRVQDQTEPM